MPTNIPLLLPSRPMIMVFLERYLKNISHVIMSNLLIIMLPIRNLPFCITILIMVLIWNTTQYSIKISSILGIWTKTFLIPPTNAELMGGKILTREVYESLCLWALPKDNLFLMNYILSTWCLHLLDGLGHYITHSGAIEKVMVMTKSIITHGYAYAKLRLNNTPDIFWKLAHTGRLISLISLKVSLDSSTPREGFIPTTSQTPDGVLRNKQPGRPGHFWQIICGTRSETQDSLTPSIPTLSSTKIIRT